MKCETCGTRFNETVGHCRETDTGILCPDCTQDWERDMEDDIKHALADIESQDNGQ